MIVPALIFPDRETAVAEMPNCRLATALREYLYLRHIHMKRHHSDGRLEIRVTSDKTPEIINQHFTMFCDINRIQIAA